MQGLDTKKSMAFTRQLDFFSLHIRPSLGIMWSRLVHTAKTACVIAVFCSGAFLFVKLAFAAVCWIGGHDSLEAMVGALASAAFGVLIGIEAFLWFRECRVAKKARLAADLPARHHERHI